MVALKPNITWLPVITSIVFFYHHLQRTLYELSSRAVSKPHFGKTVLIITCILFTAPNDYQMSQLPTFVIIVDFKLCLIMLPIIQLLRNTLDIFVVRVGPIPHAVV